MLTEVGHVVGFRGPQALVRTIRSEACSSCQAQGACIALGGSKEMEVPALNYIRAKQGDRVEVALPESSFLKASVVTYLIPLLALLGGAVLGQSAAPILGWSADAASIVLAGLGLGLAMVVVVVLNRKLADQESYIPRIVKVLPPLEGEAAEGELCEEPGGNIGGSVNAVE
jgi:sigma-E factor negative regulatory protein RseC